MVALSRWLTWATIQVLIRDSAGFGYDPLAKQHRQSFVTKQRINAVNAGRFTNAALAETESSQGSKATAQYVELPIDHFGNCSATFKNRYWVNDKYFKPNGPVFVLDYGEVGLDPSDAAWFQGETEGFFHGALKKFNGMGILLEHRYYGRSTPVPITSNVAPIDMQYLTIEQALADVPALATQVKSINHPLDDLSPAVRPWIFVGASYSGSRAAWLRQKYPNTIYASWAASAPVELRVDLSTYWLPVLEGMQAYGRGGCANDISSALDYIDKQMDDPVSSAAIKQSFLGPGSEDVDDFTFGASLQYVFSNWQDAQLEANFRNPINFSVRNLCHWLEKDGRSNDTAPVNGWAATRGAEYVVEKWRTWPPYLTKVNTRAWHCSGPFGRGKSGSKLCDWDENQPSSNPDTIAWAWQWCTQFGAIQSSGPARQRIISRHYDAAGYEAGCFRQFPTAKDQGFLPSTPDVEKVNDELDGWDANPANVFWTGNEFDPWRVISRLSQLSDAPNATLTKTPSKCNVANAADDIFGYLNPDAAHADEFGYTRGAKEAQQIWLEALDAWLPCWSAKSQQEVEPKPVPVCSKQQMNGDSGNSDDDTGAAASFKPELISLVVAMFAVCLGGTVV